MARAGPGCADPQPRSFSSSLTHGQGEEGWGRGGRPAPRKGWVLCKASLLLSAALSQLLPWVWAMGDGEEASGWACSGSAAQTPQV